MSTPKELNPNYWPLKETVDIEIADAAEKDAEIERLKSALFERGTANMMLGRENERLKSENKTLRACVRSDIDTEEEARKQFKRFFDSKSVDGDSYGVPTIADLAEMSVGEIERLKGELGDAVLVLSWIVGDLPFRRDWLNPDYEQAARAFLQKHTPPLNCGSAAAEACVKQSENHLTQPDLSQPDLTQPDLTQPHRYERPGYDQLVQEQKQIEEDLHALQAAAGESPRPANHEKGARV